MYSIFGDNTNVVDDEKWYCLSSEAKKNVRDITELYMDDIM
jgi:hypothetical protein